MSHGEASIWNPRALLALSADTKTISEKITAAGGQALFTITTFTYVVGTGALEVHKNGLLLTKGTDWVEQTSSSFFLATPALQGDVIVVTGFAGITGLVDVRDTDIYVLNYQSVRDYAGAEELVYAQGKITVVDGGEKFFQKVTGAAPGTYVDDNRYVIVPTGGDGSIAWLDTRTDFFISHPTLTAALADVTLIDGQVVIVGGRLAAGDSPTSVWDVVLTSTVTPNTHGIVIGVGNNLISLVLRRSINNTVITYGADGTAAGDFNAISAADAADEARFESGAYTLNSAYNFTNIPTFYRGAVLTVGAAIIFTKGIYAGEYVIFSSAQSFVGAGFAADTNIKIQQMPVRAAWFALKVANIADIKGIPDQTNKLMQAWRAAIGNHTLSSTPAVYPEIYLNDQTTGVLDLGVGNYRVDGAFELGHNTGGGTPILYSWSGCKLRGEGPGNSFLVRTDLPSTDVVLWIAFYSGELSVVSGLKVVCYDPDGLPDVALTFQSAARSLVFAQGDSLQLNNIWAAGAQVSVPDANGVERNGVGIQFSSCSNTYFHDLFVENCITGVAFYSSIVSGVNLELFRTIHHAIGMGNFLAEYPVGQVTTSRVNLSGVQGNAVTRLAIQCMEGGDELGGLSLANCYFSGYNSEVAAQTGTTFCNVTNEGKLFGSFTNILVDNFPESAFMSNTATGELGTATRPFNIVNCESNNQTNDPGRGFVTIEPTARCNIRCTNITLDTYVGTVAQLGATGDFSVDGLYLHAYTGKSDASATRNLINGAGCNIDLVNVRRDPTDPVALTSFVFSASGSAYVDIGLLPNSTRANSGGATFTMPSRVAFV